MTERPDAEPGEPGEATNRQEFVVHAVIVNPRAGLESSSAAIGRTTRSGVQAHPVRSFDWSGGHPRRTMNHRSPSLRRRPTRTCRMAPATP
jgi:hypothetical protein